MSKLSEALNNLKDTAADFSSLTVTTYTGNLSIMFQNSQTVADGDTPSLSNIDLDRLFTYAIGNANVTADPESKITLKAMNVHKIDGDAVLYRDEQISDDIEKAHNQAVTAGRETREGILNLIKKIVS
ncbi:hypothetical protein [Planctobacterium marinum]|uniref:hypothetical protein n=1 Tax=Planctobacterium marinum TaxID=1631968 RepID=UPI001E48A7EA|nr:hypothetical protein [Planctobacterium marinum]MCC2603803.1 hypothetical protein [Planctobacterium marinum]